MFIFSASPSVFLLRVTLLLAWMIIGIASYIFDGSPKKQIEFNDGDMIGCENQCIERPSEKTSSGDGETNSNASILLCPTVDPCVVRLCSNKELAVLNHCRIYFDYNRVDITESEKGKIDTLNKIRETSVACLYGNSDNVGSENFNKDLSLERALNVKKQMCSATESCDIQFDIVNNGKSTPLLLKKLEEPESINRRVYIGFGSNCR